MLKIETLDWADGNVPTPWHAALDQIVAASFGGWSLADMPPAHRRCVVVSGERILSHAAAQRRTFALPTGEHTGYIIGCVCTAPEQRGRGMGTRATLELLQNLRKDGAPFAVLNCGEERCGFYRRMGFRPLAPRASYRRDGSIQIDEDPVMGMALGDFDLDVLKTDVFAVGDDF